MTSRVSVLNDNVAIGILNVSVEVGALVDNLLDDLKTAGRSGMTAFPRRDPGPANQVISAVEIGRAHV